MISFNGKALVGGVVVSGLQDPLMEHAVYEQMALLSSTFAFSWSQWNAQCGQDHLVLQVNTCTLTHTHT